MGEHYKTLSAVFPIILECYQDKTQVLLLQRTNTGYMDGMWDFAGSGHVEENESAKQAVIRECREEIGIVVNIENIKFAHLSHRVGINGARTYYDIYFVICKYEGVPYIAEPQKCSALQWFDIHNLPDNLIPVRKKALDFYLDKQYYSEEIYKK